MAGIYVHIPFCERKCAYCDFLSFAGRLPHAAAYTNSLLKEIDLCAKTLPERTYDTVFFGGGTPSILDERLISDVMARLRSRFDLRLVECTIECNPGTITRQKLDGYLDAGFDRISIGAESFSDEILRTIGRIHGAAEIYEAVRLAGQAGFDNLNIDLMYGLPGQTVSDVIESLDAAAGSHASHISAYSLILEEDTPLHGMVGRGEITLPDEDKAYEMHAACIDRLKRHGYKRYEISNYCREGRESQHNLNYWNCGEYIGLGLGSSSAMDIGGFTRWSNVTELGQYAAMTGADRLPVAQTQRIPVREQMFEWVMLGLRKIEGVDRSAFLERFGTDVARVYENAVSVLSERGYIELDSVSLRLTEAGLDMQNTALMEFMEQ